MLRECSTDFTNLVTNVSDEVSTFKAFIYMTNVLLSFYKVLQFVVKIVSSKNKAKTLKFVRTLTELLLRLRVRVIGVHLRGLFSRNVHRDAQQTVRTVEEVFNVARAHLRQKLHGALQATARTLVMRLVI